MATLHNAVFIEAAPEQVWDAVRDLGALHTRLVPGFVVDTKLEGAAARVVTFGNGLVAREEILSVDDERRRLAWNAQGAKTTHYNAVLEVVPEANGTRVRWTTDLLPNEMAAPIQGMQEQALAIMQKTLQASR
jgi:carbon monoxide dehydrogenase subunit G